MNNKGFTLVELLAVIVVLAILVGIGTASVFGAMNKAEERATKIRRESVVEAGEMYGYKLNLTQCSDGFNAENYETAQDSDIGCFEEVKIEKLKDSGYLDDQKGARAECQDDDTVIIYNDYHEGMSVYILDPNTCYKD